MQSLSACSTGTSRTATSTHTTFETEFSKMCMNDHHLFNGIGDLYLKQVLVPGFYTKSDFRSYFCLHSWKYKYVPRDSLCIFILYALCTILNVYVCVFLRKLVGDVYTCSRTWYKHLYLLFVYKELEIVTLAHRSSELGRS